MMGKFESYFPEAFEQMGPIIFGHFLERINRDGFTRIRGFAERASAALSATGLLRDVPVLVILDPASRSRLRRLPESLKARQNLEIRS